MRGPVALLLLATLAGCLTPLDVPDDARTASADGARPGAPAGRIDGMTAQERVEAEEVKRCEGSLSIPPYCAVRTVVVEGRIGVDRLPVELFGGNGDVLLVSVSEGDAWRMRAVVRAGGLTEDDARRGLDAWTWSHEDAAGNHHLKAGSAVGAVPGLGAPASASYEVTLPAWVVLDVTVRTTNGDVSLAPADVERVDVTTTNGEVSLIARGADLRIRTTNGEVDAAFTPTASGKVDIATTNGEVGLALREDARRGYDLDAATTNGDIDIGLMDGETRQGAGNRASFRTHGHDERDIRTRVALETTNGEITVDSVRA